MSAQRDAAFRALEAEVTHGGERFARLSHASIIAAVALQFAHAELGAEVDPADYPNLAKHAARMEALPLFVKYPPVGPGVQAR